MCTLCCLILGHITSASEPVPAAAGSNTRQQGIAARNSSGGRAAPTGLALAGHELQLVGAEGLGLLLGDQALGQPALHIAGARLHGQQPGGFQRLSVARHAGCHMPRRHPSHHAHCTFRTCRRCWAGRWGCAAVPARRPVTPVVSPVGRAERDCIVSGRCLKRRHQVARGQGGAQDRYVCAHGSEMGW